MFRNKKEKNDEEQEVPMKLEIYSKIGFYFMLILIAVSSLISLNFDKNANVSNPSFRLDYFFHFLAYFFLVLFLVTWKQNSILERRFIFYIISFGIFYSVIFECIQIFIPNRVFNPLDFLFNLLGFAVGIVSFFILRRKYGRN